MRPHALVWIVPVVMSLVALAPLPYGYYQLLRVVMCGACAFLAYAEHKTGNTPGWKYALIIVAVLFNPLIPLHQAREVWMAFNVGAAVFLLTHMRGRRSSLAL